MRAGHQHSPELLRGHRRCKLIKGSNYLEALSAAKVVVFDKTGTLTRGVFEVTAVHHSPLAEEQLLEYAALAECASSHPISKSLQKAAGGALDRSRVTDIQEHSGRGVTAVVDGVTVAAGNGKLMEELGVAESGLHKLIKASYTLLGLISVADPVKETSAAAIQKMRGQGIRTVLLTGDNRAAAEHIGSLVGVDEVIAEVLPEEKAGVVERLQSQGRKVMMVGDGINDAPALTAATVGCAIGSGSDIAIESADIVLMRSDLQDVPRAIRLSRLTLRDIKQNLFWAFCYNTIGIPIAAGLLFAFGGPLLSPMFAGAAMSLSSVCVVGTALRLGRAKL